MARNQNKPNLLVVDDDSINRRFYIEVLGKDDYNIDEAASGEEALKRIASESYDLVVSDLQMYQVGGLDVLQAAKNKDKSTQVLIVTGYGSIPTAVKAMRNGAYDYLPKPVNKDALLLRVRKALEQQLLQRRLDEQERKLDEYHNMINRDLDLAEKVQSSLVPMCWENDRISVGIKYAPMIGIGGDYADIYYAPNDRFYMSVIDVTGHGIAAALLVNRICSELQKYVRDGYEPKEVLFHLNTFFCENFSKTGLFLTIMSVVVDFNAGYLQYAGSAHPAGLHFQQRDKSLIRLDSQNPIIGFENSTSNAFSQHVRPFATGDRIILYTDGIVETEDKNARPFGLVGLNSMLLRHSKKTADKAAFSIVQDVRKYSHGEQRDDILLMIAEIK